MTLRCIVRQVYTVLGAPGLDFLGLIKVATLTKYWHTDSCDQKAKISTQKAKSGRGKGGKGRGKGGAKRHRKVFVITQGITQTPIRRLGPTGGVKDSGSSTKRPWRTKVFLEKSCDAVTYASTPRKNSHRQDAVRPLKSPGRTLYGFGG
ncbi:Histone H4 [Holothuria leucospilota]|uniref:Histone H4 n=1 Tax=Holothuria leucospilota TaxID=206669 RepID=A0A9Q1H9R3_HOLLE|nr:Histone H4 [Holothuria leucospilota]